MSLDPTQVWGGVKLEVVALEGAQMPRPRPYEWLFKDQHLSKVNPEQKGNDCAWKCLAPGCKVTIRGSVTRAVAHVSGGSRAQVIGVAACKTVSDSVRVRLREEIGAKRLAQIQSANLRKITDGGSAISGSLIHNDSLVSGKANETFETMASQASTFSNAARSSPILRQTSIKDSTDLKVSTDFMVAKGAYATGMPLNKFRNPHVIAAYDAVARYGANYRIPSASTIARRRKDVYEFVKEKVRIITDDGPITGCTITDDGWKDVAGITVLNGCAVYAKGATFVRSAQVQGVRKDANLMAMHLRELITTVGPSNVVQVITDNANVMVQAKRNLQEMYPHITFGGCCAHGVDLAIEDICEFDCFKPMLQKARTLNHFIASRDAASTGLARCAERLREAHPQLIGGHGSPFKLIMPGETRFGTQIIMAERLKLMRPAVCQLFDSAEYIERIDPKWKEKHFAAAEIVASATFWKQLGEFIELMMPIFLLLRTFDGDTPSIGKVWYKLWQLGESIKTFKGCGITEDTRMQMHAKFYARWNLINTRLHAAGFMLDPEFWDAEYGQDSNDEVIQGFHNAATAILGIEGAAIASTQLSKYRNKEGIFAGAIPKMNARRLPAWKWWKLYGGGVPELQSLAVKVLSQVSSSSASERANSEAAHIKTMKQNRKLTSTMSMDVYIYHNLQLIDRIENHNYEEPTFEWDESSDSSDDEEGEKEHVASEVEEHESEVDEHVAHDVEILAVPESLYGLEDGRRTSNRPRTLKRHVDF